MIFAPGDGQECDRGVTDDTVEEMMETESKKRREISGYLVMMSERPDKGKAKVTSFSLFRRTGSALFSNPPNGWKKKDTQKLPVQSTPNR